MILLLITWMFVVALEAFIHRSLIVRGHKPNYLQWFIIRGMLAIVHGAIADVSNMSEYFPLLVFQLCSHFVIFNPLLNKLRSKNFWYLGETSGYMDPFFLKHMWFYKLLYVFTVVWCVISIIVLL
jgi:hypothetical protein